MLIGITGKAGCGKDTLADALIKQHGGMKIGFADPLKAACKELFQLSREQLHDRKEKEVIDVRWGKSPRQLLQFVGTDLLRKQFDTEIFIKSTKARIASLQKTLPLVVVTDCRFENESQLIRDCKGQIIHLSRPNIAEVSPHVSENALEVFPSDIRIVNDSTIEDLHVKFASAIAQAW